MVKKDELKRIKPKNQEVSEYDFLICPNCGEEEVGKFCPNCGQSNKDYNKPMKEIFADLLDSINLDIRLINTLVPFFFKPGFLTQEYFNGRRKRYVPPLRLYMFFSILFFFLAQYVSKREMDDSKKAKTEINNNRLSASLTHSSGNTLLIADSINNQDADTSINDLSELINMSDEKIQELKADALSDTTSTELEREIAVGSLNAIGKLDLFLERFYNNISFVLFALMPLFGLILGMILWRSRLMYVNHLIFSINFHSFVFGLSSVGIALYLLLPESTSGFISYLGWGVPLYLMIGIKRYYKRSYVGSFFKTLGALALYSFIIIIVLTIVGILTAKDFY